MNLTVEELLEVAYALRKHIENIEKLNMPDELEQSRSALEKVKKALRGEWP